jgi:hypothetical protein
VLPAVRARLDPEAVGVECLLAVDAAREHEAASLPRRAGGVTESKGVYSQAIWAMKPT